MRPEHLLDEQRIDECARGIVREDPVETRDLTRERRCRDHEQDLERLRR
jgi:hypothetical protein